MRNMTKKELDILIVTRDDDLLETFKGWKRSELRALKRKENERRKTKAKLPKILIFDLETAPMRAYVWGLWDQNVAINQIISDWFVISWSAKWLFNDEVKHERLTGKEAIAMNDERIIKELWKLIDEADIILAHNLDKFDKPRMNTRFLKYGLKFPSPYQTIDTLKVARREFKVSSNKLDYLCQFLGLNIKIDTGGFKLWEKCLKGDEDSLRDMDKYCQQDVLILEELYLKLRPYIRSHPNVALYMETENTVCPNCGSSKLKWKHKYTTPANQYNTARCECGAFVRSKTSTIDKYKRKKLGTPISR